MLCSLTLNSFLEVHVTEEGNKITRKDCFVLLGHGVEKDQSKAAKIYEHLSTKGHPFAQV